MSVAEVQSTARLKLSSSALLVPSHVGWFANYALSMLQVKLFVRTEALWMTADEYLKRF